MLIDPELVRCNVDASDWREAVRKSGSLLVEAGAATEAYIDKMIKSVEKFGPYMIPVPGIALFHGEPGPYVRRSSLSFITLVSPVEFKEFEGQTISCAFCLGARDSDSHLAILQEVVALLQDKEFVNMVTNGPVEKKTLISKMKKIGG